MRSASAPPAFLLGPEPSTRMASICSVSTIEPISAAMPEPTLPATMSAESTGPSSFIIDIATTLPIYIDAPNIDSCNRALERQDHPGEKAGEDDYGDGADAYLVHLEADLAPGSAASSNIPEMA